MRVCIHRGSRQIGGTCVEIAFESRRLLLDLGLPLDAQVTDPSSLLPEVAGLREPDESLLGIVLSHGHTDHWGLIPNARQKLPVIAGAATRRIMQAASAFVPGASPAPGPEATRIELADRRTVVVGPFGITPYLTDHSAYDAYSLLIEAGGRRLFYSGDIRAHGRKAALFERLVSNPPRPIHAMLMEGSSLGRLGRDRRFPTEAEVEASLVERFSQTGFIGVCASAQNIDRVVSIYRSCKRTGRTLLLDLYAMEILRATENGNIPGPGWPNLAVYVPEYQRRQVARTERFDLLECYRSCRVYREGMAAKMGQIAMLFRPAMMADIDLIPGAWDGARMIWSQWEGYLDSPVNYGFREKLAERHLLLESVHTSGHASIPDLQRLAAAMASDALVPIHTFHGERFMDLFGPNVRQHGDGEWWKV